MTITTEETRTGFTSDQERAIDRAVRRLPGYWTWDYVDANPPSVLTICPPWNGDRTAFTVETMDSGYHLRDELENRLTGEYADLDCLLRAVRAVVMGDSFDPATSEAVSMAPAINNRRKTAKGHPVTKYGPNDLTASDQDAISDALTDWEERDGVQIVDECNSGCFYLPWDERFPAFVISRENGVIRLQDNITVSGYVRLSGRYETISGALAAVRCVLYGEWHSKQPEVAARLEQLHRVAFGPDHVGIAA